jgi:hypothetical protein
LPRSVFGSRRNSLRWSMVIGLPHLYENGTSSTIIYDLHLYIYHLFFFPRGMGLLVICYISSCFFFLLF